MTSDLADGPFRYAAFGLAIESDFMVRELSPAVDETPPDLRIRRRAIDHPALPLRAGTAVDFAGDRQLLAWEAVGSFLIRERGTVIDVEPAAGVDERLLAFPLLGPVMAMCLHYRGDLVFHASAIAVNGQGAILLGDKGAGKSTTASALVTAGHPLLSDDVVAIRFSADGAAPVVVPAFPQVKLSLASSGAVRLDASVERAAHPSIEKRLHRLREGFCAEPIAPGALYMLERGTEPGLAPVESGEVLPTLIRFSYAVRFGEAALQAQLAARYVRQIAALASVAPVRRLIVPDSLQRLGEAVDLLERRHSRPQGADA